MGQWKYVCTYVQSIMFLFLSLTDKSPWWLMQRDVIFYEPNWRIALVNSTVSILNSAQNSIF